MITRLLIYSIILFNVACSIKTNLSSNEINSNQTVSNEVVVEEVKSNVKPADPNQKGIREQEDIIPCIDKAFVDPKKDCGKKVEHVCGCNGVTYTNPCEAVKRGIVLYKPGTCNGTSIK
jgi:hypothetical protein